MANLRPGETSPDPDSTPEGLMTLASGDGEPVIPADVAPATDAPTRDDVAEFRNVVLNKLTYMVGKDPGHAQEHDWFVATALAVRDLVVDRWMDATRRTYRDGRKRVYYFSLEFMIGRLLFDALGNLGVTEMAREALRDLGVDLDRLRKLEPDAALGNGGLGRLAACYMESMATLGIPAHGYGIRYD
ncbi:MAG: glycogen/starch/alpha-glucan phosphorylase, partial [Burkholderiales bacterium]|nr:glycogen/starch/alpha-glucan phosphorylase [Burkholderiales bacterium]